MKLNKSSNKYLMLALMLSVLCLSQTAFAAMPWESGIQRFAQSLCGPTARAIGVLAFAISGISIALFEVKGWIHNIMIVMIGISIAILSPTILSLLGQGGAGFACS